MLEDHRDAWSQERRLWERIRSELDGSSRLRDVVELPIRPGIVYGGNDRRDAPRIVMVDRRDGQQFEVRTERDWQEAKLLMGL